MSSSAAASRVGLIAASSSLIAVFAASASPIPLYEIYRRTDTLTHADLALTAVAYFVAVMAALLVFGRLSNHLGRRPVALAAVGAVGTLVLTEVHSVAPLIAGRMLQGLGCGLASSALAAFIVDNAPPSPSWLASAVATAQRVGMLVFLAGVVVILISLRLGIVGSFLAGSAVAGAAQGTTFAASMRALLAGAEPRDRAGILSAIYLISYGGAAIPGLIAGQLSRTLSLFDIALGYGALAALACLITLATAREPCPPSPSAATARPAVQSAADRAAA